MNCPKCNGENVLLIEYGYPHPEQYDGISEIQCRECQKRFGRWSKKELVGDEYEYRFGLDKTNRQ